MLLIAGVGVRIWIFEPIVGTTSGRSGGGCVEEKTIAPPTPTTIKPSRINTMVTGCDKPIRRGCVLVRCTASVGAAADCNGSVCGIGAVRIASDSASANALQVG